MTRLPRTSDALIQDQHTHEDWHAALLEFDAALGLESEYGYGVYVELLGDDRVRLHVPALGTDDRFDADEGEQQDATVRAAIVAAARALGISAAELGCTTTDSESKELNRQ
ncbi:hypothetical protein [Haloactinopolyspora sp.]|uniref:hypothetical protein n=1 Tax=Haloactinopolyspora sp. TaxID=1966353 RepID=UPI00261BE0BA|nr:hypothetical protein [Haloactinopolyspora sp.]